MAVTKPLSRVALRQLGLTTIEQRDVQQWEVMKAMSAEGRTAFTLLRETEVRLAKLRPGPKHAKLELVYQEAGAALLLHDPQRAVLLLTGRLEPSVPLAKTGKLIRFRHA